MADKLKVYVETSFVCYLTGDQTANAKISADQAYTRQWWGEEKSACDVFISKYVIGECASHCFGGGWPHGRSSDVELPPHGQPAHAAQDD